MRSGRIRREDLMRSVMEISPAPVEFAFLVSSRTRLSTFSICSSAVSSMVMTLSSWGMKFDRAFRKVVFPEPVPPQTKIL